MLLTIFLEKCGNIDDITDPRKSRFSFTMYNPRKAAQVIAYLVIKGGENALNVLKTVKLLYLADRESIAQRGWPILDERRVSMPHGPVNSETYSHINGEHDLTESGWADLLEDRADHNIGIVHGVTIEALDELSEADTQCLDTVWDKFGEMNQWELVEWTHDPKNVPEWEDPQGSSIPIPIERIMHMVGLENAEEHAELLKDHDRIDSLFASLPQ